MQQDWSCFEDLESHFCILKLLDIAFNFKQPKCDFTSRLTMEALLKINGITTFTLSSFGTFMLRHPFCHKCLSGCWTPSSLRFYLDNPERFISVQNACTGHGLQTTRGSTVQHRILKNTVKSTFWHSVHYISKSLLESAFHFSRIWFYLNTIYIKTTLH